MPIYIPERSGRT